jgi:hypothetical protein
MSISAQGRAVLELASALAPCSRSSATIASFSRAAASRSARAAPRSSSSAYDWIARVDSDQPMSASGLEDPPAALRLVPLRTMHYRRVTSRSCNCCAITNSSSPNTTTKKRKRDEIYYHWFCFSLGARDSHSRSPTAQSTIFVLPQVRLARGPDRPWSPI